MNSFDTRDYKLEVYYDYDKMNVHLSRYYYNVLVYKSFDDIMYDYIRINDCNFFLESSFFEEVNVGYHHSENKIDSLLYLRVEQGIESELLIRVWKNLSALEYKITPYYETLLNKYLFKYD